MMKSLSKFALKSNLKNELFSGINKFTFAFGKGGNFRFFKKKAVVNDENSDTTTKTKTPVAKKAPVANNKPKTAVAKAGVKRAPATKNNNTGIAKKTVKPKATGVKTPVKTTVKTPVKSKVAAKGVNTKKVTTPVKAKSPKVAKKEEVEEVENEESDVEVKKNEKTLPKKSTVKTHPVKAGNKPKATGAVKKETASKTDSGLEEQLEKANAQIKKLKDTIKKLKETGEKH